MGQRIDSGIVDENIEPAKLHDHLAHNRFNLLHASDIHAQAFRAGGTCRRGLGRRRIEIGVDDSAAVGCQTIRDRLADAARRTRDKTHFARQIASHKAPLGFSMRAVNVCKNRAAGTPSVMR